MSLLDFLFPKRCVACKKQGSYICSDCFSRISFNAKPICPICNRPSINGLTHPKCAKKYSLNGVFYAVVLNKITKKIIYAIKYPPFLKDLIPDITDLFYESISQNESFYAILKKKPILIPIPLSDEKLRQRGYNQAELLAKALAEKLNLPVLNLLQRTKNTQPQFGLSKIERGKNMKNAFEINKKTLNSTKIAFLIDDIMTTGSTLIEAGKILKQNSFREVWGLTFAREQNF